VLGEGWRVDGMNLLKRRYCLIGALFLFFSACNVSQQSKRGHSKLNSNQYLQSQPFKIFTEHGHVSRGFTSKERYAADNDEQSRAAAYSNRNAASRAAKAKHYKFNNYCTYIQSYRSSYLLQKSGWYQVISKRNDIVITDIEDQSELARLRGHCLRVNHFAFSPNNMLLATGGLDSIVYLWDWKIGKQLASFGFRESMASTGPHVKGLQFSPNAKQLVVNYSNNDVIVINPKTGKNNFNIDKYQHHRERLTKKQSENRKLNLIGKVLYSGDGKYLFVSRVKAIGVFSTQKGKFVRDISISDIKSISDIALDQKGKHLAISTLGKKESKLIIWDLLRNKVVKSITEKRITVNKLVISRDNRYLVSAASDGSLRIYSLASLVEIKRVYFARKGYGSGVLALRFDSNNNLHLKIRNSQSISELGQLIVSDSEIK